MSHSDANFRNTADSTLATIVRDVGRQVVNVPSVGGAYPPFLNLECGTTVEADLVSWGIRSFFRTPDLVTNQAYYARECHFRKDTPGQVTFIVTASGFTPYAVLVRDEDPTHRWFSNNGVITVNVTDETVGPFTLEVTSESPYSTGHFSVQTICSNPGNKFLRIYWYFNHASQLSLLKSDFQLKWQQLRAVVAAFDMSTLTVNMTTVYAYDGSTLTLDGVYTPQTTQGFSGGAPDMFVNCYSGLLALGIFQLDGVTWMGNEYYLVIERATVQIPPVNIPYNIDLLTRLFAPVTPSWQAVGSDNSIPVSVGAFNTNPFRGNPAYIIGSSSNSFLISSSTGLTNPNVDIQNPDITFDPNADPDTGNVPNFMLYRDTVTSAEYDPSDSFALGWNWTKFLFSSITYP